MRAYVYTLFSLRFVLTFAVALAFTIIQYFWDWVLVGISLFFIIQFVTPFFRGKCAKSFYYFLQLNMASVVICSVIFALSLLIYLFFGSEFYLLEGDKCIAPANDFILSVVTEHYGNISRFYVDGDGFVAGAAYCSLIPLIYVNAIIFVIIFTWIEYFFVYVGMNDLEIELLFENFHTHYDREKWIWRQPFSVRYLAFGLTALFFLLMGPFFMHLALDEGIYEVIYAVGGVDGFLFKYWLVVMGYGMFSIGVSYFIFSFAKSLKFVFHKAFGL